MPKKKGGKTAATDGETKAIRQSPSQIRTQKLETFNNIAATHAAERKKEREDLKQLQLPLLRVNSLPLIFAHRFVKPLFTDSKSANFGYEPDPEIPNATAVLDDVPDNALDELKKDIKSDEPGGPTSWFKKASSSKGKTPKTSERLTFTKVGAPDDHDEDSLNKIKRTGRSTFLKHRVGEKALDKIVANMDPLGDLGDKIEEKKKKRACLRNLLLCFLLPLFLALGVWIGIFYQWGRLKLPDPPMITPAPILNGSEFEYLPAAKLMRLVMPFLVGKMSCEYPSGMRIVDDITPIESKIIRYYTDKIKKIFELMNTHTGAFLLSKPVKKMELIQMSVHLFPVYHEVLPSLLWMGMNFDVTDDRLKDQLFIFANSILAVHLQQIYKVSCSIDREDIKDRYVTQLRKHGVVWQQLFKPAPADMAGMYEGLIRRQMRRE